MRGRLVDEEEAREERTEEREKGMRMRKTGGGIAREGKSCRWC